MQALEPLLLELRDRVIQATGEEPREVLANRGFMLELLRQRDHFLVTKSPFSYVTKSMTDFTYEGIPIRCILPTDITTLVAKV